MGGLQAYEWAQSYPDSVDRIVAVVAYATPEPVIIAIIPFRIEPDRRRPHVEPGDQTFGTAPAEEGKDPARALANRFKIEGFLDQAATARAALADANHFLYLCKANQVAAVDPAKIKSPALVLYAPNDLVFYEPIVRETLQKIAEAGRSVESGTLVGPNGHLDAFTAIVQGADKIAAFLTK
jgi:homoserine O-acetyltransferase/O-succinyltransferase